MKELIAIIRPGKTKLTKQKLAEQGIVSCTQERVSGRGKQKGLRYQGTTASNLSGEVRISFLSKSMLTIFLNDDGVEKAVAAILEVNKTGDIGDGKIFICPLEETIRIRTDEKAHAAL